MNELQLMQALPRAVLLDHMSVVGKTGRGKSTTSRGIVIQAKAQLPDESCCILDPIKSDWWGITLAADGISPGEDFLILGGPHGHVPLHSGSGAAIGELVATGKLKYCVIDMADFEMGGIGRFYKAFAEVVFRKIQVPLRLVLEEAHEFAPKDRSGVGDENMCLYWSKKLATGARTKGVRLMALTQRVQKLHNDILGSSETIIAHGLVAPADQEPILKWFKSNASREEARDVEESLSSLPRGTAWVKSGEAGIFGKYRFPLHNTFDNTSGRHDRSKSHGPAPIDREALRALIGDAVKEAEDNDVETLKARIKELEAGNSKGGHGTSLIPREVYEADKLNAYEQGVRAAATKLVGVASDIDNLSSEIYRQASNLRVAASQLHKQVDPSIGPDAPESYGGNDEHRAEVAHPTRASTASSADAAFAHATSPATPRRARLADGASGPSYEALKSATESPSVRKILDVIHSSYPVSLSFDAAARRAAISNRSSAYRKYRAAVLNSHECELSSGKLRSKPEFARSGFNRRATLAEWEAKLPPSYGLMLRAVGQAKKASREEIARLANVSITSSGLGAGLRELISLSLIRQGNDGLYQLEDGLQ